MFMCFKKEVYIAETPTDLWKHRNQHVKREIKLPNFPFLEFEKYPDTCLLFAEGHQRNCIIQSSLIVISFFTMSFWMLKFHVKQGGAPQSVTWPDTVDSLAEPLACYWTWRQKEIRDEGNSTCNLILPRSQACDSVHRVIVSLVFFLPESV